MVYLLAIAASFSNALTSVLQRMGVEYAPADHSMRLRLVGHILRQKVWLVGFGLMIASFLMQATALHDGRLAEVQPLLTTELLFLVLILGTRFQFTVGWREWTGAVLAAGGLAGFLVFANPRGGGGVPPTSDWVGVGVACLAAIVVGVVAAQRGPALVAGRGLRDGRGGGLRLHRRPDQGGDRLRRHRLGSRCSATGRPTAWPPSACWPCS